MRAFAGQSQSRTAKRKNISSHVLIDADSPCWSSTPSEIPASSAWQEGWSVKKPFMLSKAEEVLKLEFIEKRFKEFGGLFAGSSVRITEGRAQAPLKGDEVTGPLHKYLESLSSEFISQLPPGEEATYPELSSSMAASTFGLATSQVSVGKFEVNMFPSIRLTYQGSRFVTIILLDGVLDMLSQPAKSGSAEDRPSVNLQQVQEWVFNATQADVEKLCQANKAFAGTVGSTDLIYLPPGCLVCHRVHSGDVLGIRCGVLGQEMEDGLTSISKLCPANMCVQQATSFLKSQTPPPPQESKEEGPPQESKEDGQNGAVAG